MNKMADGSQVLLSNEAEAFVSELKEMSIESVGSDNWFLQRERLEKLSIQAVLNVSQDNDEFIKSYLVSYNKLRVLIHELLVIDVWKRQVFSILFKHSLSPTTSFPTYLVLYHETVLVGLLEVALYYQEVVECLDDSVLDLIDYCYRKITHLIAAPGKVYDNNVTNNPDASINEELMRQKGDIEFNVEMKCISLIHYISNHLKHLPLSIVTRLLNTHDFPSVLVDLIQLSPWTNTDSNGKILKYEDGKWKEVGQGCNLKLNKVEGQVWLTLYQLLLGQDSQNKYQYTSFNKEHLLKLRGYLTDPVIEQVPPLVSLQRYLQQLSLMEPPPASTGLILEQVPIMFDSIMKEGEGKWERFAVIQSKLLLQPDPESLKTQATRWVDQYSSGVLDTIIDGPPKCTQCGNEATKRCSRCCIEWYCSRECQVKNWKKHKPSCDMLYQSKPHPPDHSKPHPS